VYVSRPEVQTYYSPWLVETQFYYNTAVIPMGGFGSLGISSIVTAVKEIPRLPNPPMGMTAVL
jgi:hypothetical protein